ncbi:MAG TPA: Ig-like domain repeat protein, partial [Candidatus Bathyarchaeia archaeon]|nr:Ig-like domain repeat protein [Candidatus Bathyarchaeia archaeon]
SCSVTLTGSAVGTASVVGNYTGDNGHTSSKNTVNITVNPRSSATSLTCTSSSVAVNASDSCTIYVKDTSAGTPIVPGGSVSLELDGSSTGFTTCNLQTFNSTTASCAANYTPAPGTEGPHTLNANYHGDSTHLASSSKTLALNVTTRTSSTTVNCTPATVAVGQTTTCTATVKDTSAGIPITPSGLVNFSVTPSGSGSFTGSCILSQSVVGTATCNIQYGASSTGFQTITGTYAGDADHSAGTPGTFTLTVNVQSTASVINCASSSVVVGTSDSCIVTVKDVTSGPSSTPASGTVSASLDSPSSFFANCQLASINATASSCSVTYTASSGTEGSHNIIATYSPDSSHGASSSSLAVLVTQRSSTATLLCGASTLTVGSNDPCTATIRDTSVGAPITPTGGASFFLDASSTSFAGCTSLTPVNSTSATCTVTFTPASGSEGSHSITAKYSGDTDHSSSTSSTSNVSVVQRTTSTGISCSPSTLSVGQATTCTATVRDTSTGTLATPTGTVNFSVTPSGSGSFTGTCSLAESTPGTATCIISYTPSSTSAQTITGAYPGDIDHSSGQGTFSLNVNLQTTVTTVNCATTIAVNSADSCTAIVKDSPSSSASTSPAGSVSFTLDSSSTSFASCTLKVVNTTTANCNAAYTPALGTEGSHSITATYSPDTTHSSSTGSTSVTATQRTTTTIVSCVSPVVVGQAAQCTATVTDSSGAGATSPSGSVSFTEAGSSGSLSAQSCSLTAGSTGASSCYITFTGSATGTATVNGAYAPTDPDHSASLTTTGGTTTI